MAEEQDGGKPRARGTRVTPGVLDERERAGSGCDARDAIFAAAADGLGLGARAEAHLIEREHSTGAIFVAGDKRGLDLDSQHTTSGYRPIRLFYAVDEDGQCQSCAFRFLGRLA